MTKTIGIDFGTSNSAVAIGTGDGKVKVATFARHDGGEADTTPTVLFFPEHEKQLFFGYEAVGRYLFGGLEGRFIQSMKTFLPASTFTGTQIRGRHLQIEDLVAVFLKRLLEQGERALGERIEGSVVLGRPARFSLDKEADALAEARLLEGAKRAGLKDVQLLIEPVAAALAYEATLETDQTVLVADLGGGTSDFTLMRVGPGERKKASRRGSILAAGGVPIAGDRIDGEVVRARLLPELGVGSHYVALTERTQVPHWIFQKLLAWNHLSLLKTKKYMDFLRLVHQTSDQKDAIGALIRIVDENQGYLLFRAVERAKRELSEHTEARIADEEHALPVAATVTREQFDEATRALVRSIFEAAESVLSDAGLSIDRVDAVFMTGGTSLLPAIRRAFSERFGADRIHGRSTFTSVVDGLARGAGVGS